MITIYAPTPQKAEEELLEIAQECGATVTVVLVCPQGHHNWLVSYKATVEDTAKIEEWVS